LKAKYQLPIMTNENQTAFYINNPFLKVIFITLVARPIIWQQKEVRGLSIAHLLKQNMELNKHDT
jgi:hypothetical protein